MIEAILGDYTWINLTVIAVQILWKTTILCDYNKWIKGVLNIYGTIFNLFEHVKYELIKNVNILNVLLKNEYSISYANSKILSK